MGTRVDVDVAALRSLASNMVLVKSTLESDTGIFHEGTNGVEHPDLIRAVNKFEENWSDRRREIQEALETTATTFNQVAENFESCDQQLKAALDGDGDGGGGAGGSGGPGGTGLAGSAGGGGAPAAPVPPSTGPGVAPSPPAGGGVPEDGQAQEICAGGPPARLPIGLGPIVGRRPFDIVQPGPDGAVSIVDGPVAEGPVEAPEPMDPGGDGPDPTDLDGDPGSQPIVDPPIVDPPAPEPAGPGAPAPEADAPGVTAPETAAQGAVPEAPVPGGGGVEAEVPGSAGSDVGPDAGGAGVEPVVPPTVGEVAGGVPPAPGDVSVGADGDIAADVGAGEVSPEPAGDLAGEGPEVGRPDPPGAPGVMGGAGASSMRAVGAMVGGVSTSMAAAGPSSGRGSGPSAPNPPSSPTETEDEPEEGEQR